MPKTWNSSQRLLYEARDIITVAKIIGRQVKETSELLNEDIATGKPLLNPS